MIISHKHKFIFFHIPKTGGSSSNGHLHKYGRTLAGPHNFNSNANREFFRFGFFRNPWDRFVSNYFYFKAYGQMKGRDLHDGKIVNRYNSFLEFTLNFPNIYEELKSRHWSHQVNWVKDRIDFIGRFENLQDDFNIVCDKIGIPRQQLPHKNKSKHKHYTEYYDDETKQIVAEKYAKDIEYFGYEFGE
jgi:hypothetical protein